MRAAQRALCVQIYCTAHGDAFMRELFRHPLDVPRLGNLFVISNELRQVMVASSGKFVPYEFIE